jgi:hypothetical protein
LRSIFVFGGYEKLFLNSRKKQLSAVATHLTDIRLQGRSWQEGRSRRASDVIPSPQKNIAAQALSDGDVYSKIIYSSFKNVSTSLISRSREAESVMVSNGKPTTNER